MQTAQPSGVLPLSMAADTRAPWFPGETPHLDHVAVTKAASVLLPNPSCPALSSTGVAVPACLLEATSLRSLSCTFRVASSLGRVPRHSVFTEWGVEGLTK